MLTGICKKGQPMHKYAVTIYCSLCDAKHTAEIELPSAWHGAYDGIDDEHGLCPKHQAVQAFKDSQCPGCVGGWGDCGLFDSFAFSGRTKPRGATALSELDFKRLRRGVCPRRVNGTMSVHSFPNGNVTVEDVNLSTVEVDGGRALAKAINEYIEKYSQPEIKKR